MMLKAKIEALLGMFKIGCNDGLVTKSKITRTINTVGVHARIA